VRVGIVVFHRDRLAKPGFGVIVLLPLHQPLGLIKAAAIVDRRRRDLAKRFRLQVGEFGQVDRTVGSRGIRYEDRRTVHAIRVNMCQHHLGVRRVAL